MRFVLTLDAGFEARRTFFNVIIAIITVAAGDIKLLLNNESSYNMFNQNLKPDQDQDHTSRDLCLLFKTASEPVSDTDTDNGQPESDYADHRRRWNNGCSDSGKRNPDR